MAADQSSEKPGAADESLRLFLSRTRAREDPSAVYTFDGERGIARTVICREPSSSQPETRQRVGGNSAVEQGKSRQKDCLVVSLMPLNHPCRQLRGCFRIHGNFTFVSRFLLIPHRNRTRNLWFLFRLPTDFIFCFAECVKIVTHLLISAARDVLHAAVRSNAELWVLLCPPLGSFPDTHGLQKGAEVASAVWLAYLPQLLYMLDIHTRPFYYTLSTYTRTRHWQKS